MLNKMMVTKVMLLVIAVLVAGGLAACEAMLSPPEHGASNQVGSGDGQSPQGEEHHSYPTGDLGGVGQPPDEATTTPSPSGMQYGNGVDPTQGGSPADATSTPTAPTESSPSPDAPDRSVPMPASGCTDPSVLTPEQAMKCINQHEEVDGFWGIPW